MLEILIYTLRLRSLTICLVLVTVFLSLNYHAFNVNVFAFSVRLPPAFNDYKKHTFATKISLVHCSNFSDQLKFGIVN